MSRLVVGAIVVSAAAFTAVLAVRAIRAPEETAAQRGHEVAERMGCFGCHGAEGIGGVHVPKASSAVPGWTTEDVEMYIRSETDITDWILDGAPDDLSRPPDSPPPLVPMPAYRGRLTAEELGDLVAYFRAASGWSPELTDGAYEGWRASYRLGCFGCHGPSGMGGIGNPGSFKGHIPAWDGEEFADLVRDDDELREWILAGRIERLWSNPAARVFLEGQTIQMPAYEEHISEADVTRIVDYITWLRR